MKDEKTKTKEKKTVTKKAANKTTAKKVKRKASEKTGDRKHRLKPKEREQIRGLLVAHYGVSKVETFLATPSGLIKEIEPKLIQMKKQMEVEIEAQERDVKEYYAEIKADYKKVGRPKSVFNWEEFEYLCAIGCSAEEIAGFFQVSKPNVYERVKEEYNETFSERYEKLSQGVKVSLRRAQIKAALDGDVNMQKFLGINILGQKNKLDFSGEVKVNSWVDLLSNLEPDNNTDNTDEE